MAVGGPGLRDVRLRLTRKDGHRCARFDGRPRAVRRAPAAAAPPTARSSRWAARAAWSYQLPARLPRGRYVLDLRTVDRAGVVTKRLVRGRDAGGVRRPMRRRPALLAACAALAAGAAGCGVGAGGTPSGVELKVTTGFGQRAVARADAPRIDGADTVMRLLQRNAKVTTRFGGGFVQSIDGLAGGRQGGAPVDWFYYVNGIEARKGAAATKVHDGDHALVGPPRLAATQRRPGGRRLVPRAVPPRRRAASACRCASSAPTRRRPPAGPSRGA